MSDDGTRRRSPARGRLSDPTGAAHPREHPTPGPSAAETFVRLLARVPELGSAPATNEMLQEVRALIRDAGRELKRLRRVPRLETAPIARLRTACRDLLAALRTSQRANRALDSARGRILRLREPRRR